MDKANPNISVSYADNATIATLTDERILEEEDIQLLENSLIPLTEQADGVNLIIDFSNVKFFSSSVLGLLIRVSKKIYEAGGQLRLCSINPKILKIFKVTRLDRVFDIYNGQDSAMESLD